MVIFEWNKNIHTYIITVLLSLSSCNHRFKTKLSRSQGFPLHGTNHEELLSIRVLVVALVQALVDLVQALVALVQAHVDLVQALVALNQAHVDLVLALVALVQALVALVQTL